MQHDSPQGRHTVRLTSLCRLLGGYGFPERLQGASEGELPFTKVSDMSAPGNQRDIVTAANWVSRRTADAMGWEPFPAGSVVFAKVGAALRLNRRRLLTRPTLVDNNMMAAVPQGGLDSVFFLHFLSSVDFGQFVQEGALPSVNQQRVGALRLPNLVLSP